MTPLYLARAGRTGLREQVRLQGLRDLPLTDAGIEDALDAARGLAGLEIGAVFSSPLLRARQTADAVCRAVGTRCRIVPDLIDVDVGRWEAMTTAEIVERGPLAFDRYFRMPLAATYPSGERIIDAERRVFGALGQIARICADQAAVAVTHEIPIRSVLLRLRRLEGTAFWDPHLAQGSVAELRVTNDGFELPTVLEDLFRAADRRRSEGERG